MTAFLGCFHPKGIRYAYHENYFDIRPHDNARDHDDHNDDNLMTIGDKFLGMILGVDLPSSDLLIQCLYVPHHHQCRRRRHHHHHHHLHDNDGDEW